MAEDGTALLEGATGTELEATEISPESIQADVPANDDLPVTTETDDTPDPFADYEDDSFTKSQKIQDLLKLERERTSKDTEARVRESERQKQEVALKNREREVNAQTRARQVQEAESAEKGGILNGIAQIVDNVIDHDIDPSAKDRFAKNIPMLQQIAGQVSQAVAIRQDTLSVALVNQHLTQNFPDYRIAPDVVANFNDALNKGDFAARQEITYALIADAAVKAKESSLRETIVKEMKAQAEKDAHLTMERTNSTAARQQGGPTNVTGLGVSTTNPSKYLNMTSEQIANLGDAEMEQAIKAVLGRK